MKPIPLTKLDQTAAGPNESVLSVPVFVYRGCSVTRWQFDQMSELQAIIDGVKAGVKDKPPMPHLSMMVVTLGQVPIQSLMVLSGASGVALEEEAAKEAVNKILDSLCVHVFYDAEMKEIASGMDFQETLMSVAMAREQAGSFKFDQSEQPGEVPSKITFEGSGNIYWHIAMTALKRHEEMEKGQERRIHLV